MSNFYQSTIQETLKKLGTREKGLTQEEAEEKLEKYGENKLEKKEEIHPLEIFLRQFKDTLVIILILAAVFSFAIGHMLDGGFIVIIVILNSILGFIQEYKAEESLQKLKEMTAPEAIVIRDGEEEKIPAKKLVPGDIILIQQGDKVPADARIIESMNFKVNEAVLTGESLPEDKHEEKIKEERQPSERTNMVYMGSTATYGHAKAIVTATGMETEFGEIAGLITEREKTTPLQKKLATFGKRLGAVILAVAAIISIIGILQGGSTVQMILTGITLAVAAIPEGLPAVVTITLGLGVKKMAKENALVRKLPAVETLGSTTVICSDKTGTITRNEMTVEKIKTEANEFKVTGSGYKEEGEFKLDEEEIDPEKYKELHLALETGFLCNNAEVRDDSVLGDPTEGALFVVGEKAGIEKEKHGERLHEIPFSSNRKRMTVVYENEEKMAYVKGAAETILERCNRYMENGEIKELTEKKKEKFIKENDEMSSSGLRVLAMAHKKLEKDIDEIEDEEIEEDLIFTGLIGMIDAPREGVKEDIEKCRQAGIDVKMITGDNEQTARAVAKEVGLSDEEPTTGKEIDKLTDEELREVVEEKKVFARVSPKHKVRIVEALKNNDEVVAVTGDGVNDAPALKKGHIGISMGITGTDVTKETGEMILLDDDFSTIVQAVERGRNIYQNIKKFVRYLLSCNAGEVATMLFAVLAAFAYLPLLPVQILWVNLVTDGLPALALGSDPLDPEEMKRPPRDKHESIIDREMVFLIIFVGIIMAAGTLFMFTNISSGKATHRTIAFTALITMQMFLVYSMKARGPMNIRDITENKKLIAATTGSMALQVMVVYLPFMNVILHTTPLAPWVWGAVLGLGLLSLIVVETGKRIFLYLDPEEWTTRIS